MPYQDMAGEASKVQPPFTAESLGKPLLLNSHVRDFLTGFPMQDWPKVVEVGGPNTLEVVLYILCVFRAL